MGKFVKNPLKNTGRRDFKFIKFEKSDVVRECLLAKMIFKFF